MFFSACILASPLGSKRSFSNLLELSTNFYAILLFCGKSMSHSCLILFIKVLPFFLSFLFICTNFNFFCLSMPLCQWYEQCCHCYNNNNNNNNKNNNYSYYYCCFLSYNCHYYFCFYHDYHKALIKHLYEIFNLILA